MSLEPSIFFDEVNERQGVFHRRTFLFGGFAGLGTLALVGRLADLQLVEGTRYQLLSNSNQFNFRLQPPPRGRILDRNGVEIASNRPEFRVLYRRGDSKDATDTIDKLASLIPITEARKAALLKEIANSPKAMPISLANDLSWDDFARVNVRAPDLLGVNADMGEARVYPFGGAFAHVIGYVSRVSADDLEKEAGPDGKPDPLLLHPGFRIGKQGVEEGAGPGSPRTARRPEGRGRQRRPHHPRRPGRRHQGPARQGCGAVARCRHPEPRPGSVRRGLGRGGDDGHPHRRPALPACPRPRSTPTSSSGGIPAPVYRQLAEYERKPLLNKAVAGLYPPGSTFKTMVALAALEAGQDPKRTYTCNGAFAFGNHVFKCDHHHGTLDMHGAIATSCDVFFYQTALNAGIDRIAEVATRFGLGQTFDIGISGQRKGIVPSTEWKRNYFKKTPANQKWFPGETPSCGIGQGYVSVNPLQLCVMASRLANGKKALNPRLIRLGRRDRTAARLSGAGPRYQQRAPELRARRYDVRWPTTWEAPRSRRAHLGPGTYPDGG